jgi:hypothetical protein
MTFRLQEPEAPFQNATSRDWRKAFNPLRELGAFCSKIIVSRSEGIYPRLTKSIILVLFPIIFLNFTLISIADNVQVKVIPFKTGEKLTYKGTWGIIPAGELTLEVLPKETINGVETYHFVMITKTSAVVDLIYKVRERQDSYVDTGMTHSIFYKKKTESEHPRDESINFNWEKLEATYTNFGQTKLPIHILPGTFDPLGFFYAIRLQTLKSNSEIHLPVTDGNNVNIEARVIVGKRDTIEVEGKMYDTIEVTPNMEMLDKLKQVVKESDHPQLKVWVTADEKKIPLKIRTKIGIISFDFDLVLSPSLTPRLAISRLLPGDCK